MSIYDRAQTAAQLLSGTATGALGIANQARLADRPPIPQVSVGEPNYGAVAQQQAQQQAAQQQALSGLVGLATLASQFYPGRTATGTGIGNLTGSGGPFEIGIPYRY